MRLILWLWEWQLARMLGAVALSLSAVSFFVVTVSLVLLPADLEKLQAPLYLSITHCHVTPAAEQAISVVWYMPHDSRAGWRHQLALHDLAGGRPPLQLNWPELAAYSAASSRDRRTLYVGCWNGGLWRVKAARPAAPAERLGEHPEPGPHSIAAAEDGRWLVTLGPKTLQVLDMASGRPAWSRTGDVRCFALHPEGRRILANLADGRLLELDCATGKTLRLVTRFDEPAITAAFSPDGRRAALVGGSGSLTLLDWDTGRSAWPPGWRDQLHLCRSGTILFSPSGDRLITGGRDTARLAVWNLRTMELETELCGHEKSINGATFLDEQRLCSFGADGSIRVWDLAGRGPPQVITLDVTPQAS